GGAIHHDGDPGRTVALVARCLEMGTLHLARAALDRPVDVVLGHALRLGTIDGRPQTRVGGRVAAAGTGCRRDLAYQLGENLAALGVLSSLPEAYVGPLAVARHVTVLLLPTIERPWDRGRLAARDRPRARYTPTPALPRAAGLSYRHLQPLRDRAACPRYPRQCSMRATRGP